MNRERLLPVVLALVCVVAFAFVAASVVNPTDGGGGSTVTDPAGGDDRDSGENGSSGRDPLTEPGSFQFGFSFCIPFLLSDLFFVSVIGAALLLWSVLAYRDDGFAASAVLVAIGFPGFFLWLLLTGCSSASPPKSFSILPSEPADPSVGGNASVGVAQDSGIVLTQPPVVIVLLAATVLVGILGYVVWLDSDDEESTEERPAHDGTDEAPGAGVAAIGNVAGEIADRLERDARTENEVFRAWVTMTEHLPVDHPRSSTPAEFAEAAVDAGVAREDVVELTELFEEVRYGGEPATEDRELRAIEALRHIESEYGDE